MTEEKMQAIQYNLFRWGPCLVKLKISEENRKLFLSEGRASLESYEKRLAGILKKEVQFRDYKNFEKFFSEVFFCSLVSCLHAGTPIIIILSINRVARFVVCLYQRLSSI